MLLLRHGRVVSVDELIAGLWQDQPPRTARSLLHVYISRLRPIIRPSYESGAHLLPCTIDTVAGGYQLQLNGHELDLETFASLEKRAYDAEHAGDLVEASACMSKALSLRSGPILSDLRQVPGVRPTAAWLEEACAALLEHRTELDMALGRHRELVGELGALFTENPLRETMSAYYLVALYRSGRVADALHAYRRIRDRSVEELGIEPPDTLQRLHQLILTRHPCLTNAWHPASLLRQITAEAGRVPVPVPPPMNKPKPLVERLTAPP